METRLGKRLLKNIIAIAVIVVMCGASFFTMKYAADNVSASAGSGAQQEMQGGQMPGQSDSSDSSSSGSSDSSTGGGQQPPDKPDGNGSDQAGGQNDSQQQDGSSGSSSDTKTMSSSKSSSGSSDTTQQPPDKPSGDNSSAAQVSGQSGQSSDGQSADSSSSDQQSSGQQSDGSGTQNGQAPQGQPGGMSGNGGPGMEQSISYIYYILFGAEGLVIALAVMYLIMTRFSRRSLRKVFRNRDKLTIFILATILITSGLTFAEGTVTEKCFMGSGGGGAPTGQSAEDVSYSAAKEITEDTTIKSGTFKSSTKDENAILATGDIKAVLSGITVKKTGDSDGGDSSSFYGNNSGILAKDGASLTIKNAKIKTAASGANGVFSFGGSATTDNSSSDGTSVSISDSEITTTGDNAGGIMTTGGGKMAAKDLTINTAGTSSAAIRTDRGGGSVSVTGGTYTTTGKGSPSIYSTADISVSDADLISKTSEGVVIEGKNSVTLENCKLTDSNTQLNGQSTTYKNIFLYQSMSGDAADGEASFTAKNSSITTKKGDTLYVTNTTATIELENNTITNKDSDGSFLRIQKDSWGNSGSNGGDVTLKMVNQEASGNIDVDSISTLEMTMSDGSVYEGTINGDKSAKSLKLTLDKSSKIKLTGDSYVSSLDDADEDYSNIDFNGYKLYVDGKAIN